MPWVTNTGIGVCCARLRRCSQRLCNKVSIRCKHEFSAWGSVSVTGGPGDRQQFEMAASGMTERIYPTLVRILGRRVQVRVVRDTAGAVDSLNAVAVAFPPNPPSHFLDITVVARVALALLLRCRTEHGFAQAQDLQRDARRWRRRQRIRIQEDQTAGKSLSVFSLLRQPCREPPTRMRRRGGM